MNPNSLDFLSETSPFEERLQRFRQIIDKSKRIVFFGGAGVSTGSGIPDFRSSNGLYNNMPDEVKQYEPEYLLSLGCLAGRPELFFDFYRKHMDLRSYQPNTVHKYFAELEKQGKMNSVVTQNIDLLHEKAGTTKIQKIHGTISTCHCCRCGKRYDTDYIFEDRNCTNGVPLCAECGNIVRPDIVLYGEALPTYEFIDARDSISSADCLIICGTSLTVYPAAYLVDEFQGDSLVIINMTQTPHDAWADVIFREDMNEVFSRM